EGFVTAAGLLDSALNQDVRQFGGVAAVVTQEVRAIPLTVKPSPVPEGPRGHVLIPELNYSDYDKKDEHGKRPGRDWIKGVADLLVRRADIRIHPTQKPGQAS